MSADSEEGGEGPPAKGYEELLGQLDLQLSYLWRVHNLDYYAGREYMDAAECSAAKRTLRGPRPEEGEQPDEAEGGLAWHTLTCHGIESALVCSPSICST